MQQVLTCPGCNSPIAEGQQFCGVCGAKLDNLMSSQIAETQQQLTVCLGCGTPITGEQQFCGICGAKLSDVSQQAQVSQVPFSGEATVQVAPQTFEAASPPAENASASIIGLPPSPPAAPVPSESVFSTTGTALPAFEMPPSGSGIIVSPRKNGILTATAIIFQIFGWIILVGGCLGSIAMGVFAGIGGSFISIIPGFDTIAGMTAIIWAIGGIIVSLLYGFGFLAFAEFCYVVIDLGKNVWRGK